MPKTYRMSAWRYREGSPWSTIYKGRRIEFVLGPVLKRTPRPGLNDELVVQVLPR